MSDPMDSGRYRELFARFDETRPRSLVDQLQVLALTHPDALHELEAFIDRVLALVPGDSSPDCTPRLP